MGVLDRFERGVENVVSAAFSKAFRSGVKPVELIAAVKKQADTSATEVDRDRTVAPNEYELALSDADYKMVVDWGAEALQHECELALSDHASFQRYVLVGAVSVRFVLDPSLPTGRYTVSSRTSRAPAETASSAVSPGRADPGAYPLLDVDGRRYHLTEERTIVGRGSEADVVVDDSGVSRDHCRFDRTPYGTILTDLESTNGTYVEDQKIKEVTLVDGNAITVGRTTIMYWEPIEAGGS